MTQSDPTSISDISPARPQPGQATALGTLPNIPGFDEFAELGRGGMGVVYRARDLELNRTVAIKMVLGGGIAGPNALARFLAEAEALAALAHPNIVQVYDRGQFQGLPYFVMEFCAGESLGSRVRDKPLSPRGAAELVEQLARGVAAAHARNILHRDLKPDNVLFTADGTPKITDFGLAKRFDDSGEASTELTVTGMVMGTPSYMAPEQAMGQSKRVGPAADVYALGAILCRIVVGRPPFLGASNADTIRQVIDDDPVSPSRFVPSLPRDLATICLKCLQKEPARRYASAHELADDLRRFLDGRPILARPVGSVERAAKWVRRNPMVAGSIVAAVLALIAGATVSYMKYRDAKEQEGIAGKRADETAAALSDRSIALADTVKALGQRDDALADANYQLGINNFLLASAAYDNRDIAQARERLDRVPIEQRKWEWHYLRRLCEGGLFTLTGHANRVTCVAYSPDGKRIATASDDNTARIWNARTGALLLEIKGHAHWVACIAFSPDGTKIATASRDRTVRACDARTGALLTEIKGHAGAVTAVAFSPDGTRIATTSEDRTARIWDARLGTPLLAIRGFADRTTSVAFSPDGHSIAIGSVIDAVKVFHARTGKLLMDLKRSAANVMGVVFSPDGSRIVTAEGDGTAQLWDARTGAPLAVMRGHLKSLTSVAFNPDGTQVATGSLDHTARIWDASSGAVTDELKGHTSPVTSVAFSPDGERLATASMDWTAKLWDAQTGATVIDMKGHRNWVSAVAFAGERIVSASHDKSIKVWDAHTGDTLLNLLGHVDRVTAVAVNTGRTRIVSGSEDKTAKIWDAGRGELLMTLSGHTGRLTCVAYSDNGSHIATGSEDQTAIVWDARTGVRLLNLTGHAGHITGVAFTPPAALLPRLATADKDGVVKMWDTRTGDLVLNIRTDTRRVTCLAFSPDGKRLATASIGRPATVRDATTGNVLLELIGHTNEVTCVAYSLDGARIVTGNMDRTARVWDARTGTPLFELKAHKDHVTGVAFDAGGTKLATASYDGSVKVWDTRSSASGDDAYRLMHTRPDAARHNNASFAAILANDRWAAAFHIDRWLALEPYALPAYKDRNDFVGDPRLIARASFHRPELARSPYDRGVLQALAVAGDRLAKRIVAQEFIRSGTPRHAIPILFECMLMRPPRSPPVEELLLALASIQMNQLDDARRFHRVAVDWLDRPRQPMRAANMVTHATNPWNAIAEAFKPIDDPRRDPFDWESWHECDVFRIQVDVALGAR